ncbi:MAG TPA: hypothetical protein VFG20_20400 [Planctomycetaceae bacterium]|nr:hypothetical protein [Planctomycetaceae bacterium]
MSDHDLENHGPRQATATLESMKIEPQELQFFDDEDRVAGQAIGKLLCFFFVILLTLMASVTAWSVYNDSRSDDPQADVGSAYHTDEH